MELFVNKVICHHLSYLITQTNSIHSYKSKFVMYWTVIGHISGVLQDIKLKFSHKTYEPGASFKL